MPNYETYITPDYMRAQLDGIIVGQDIRRVMGSNPNAIIAPFQAGLENGMNGVQDGRMRVTVQGFSDDLSDRIITLAQGMFNLSTGVGTSLSQDLRSGGVSPLELPAILERILSNIVGYVNPEGVEGFKRANRSLPVLAPMLPPDININ